MHNHLNNDPSSTGVNSNFNLSPFRTTAVTKSPMFSLSPLLVYKFFGTFPPWQILDTNKN